MKPLLCALLIALLLATPVAATVQYPEEYYTLGQQADALNAWHLKGSVMAPDEVNKDRWGSSGSMVSDASALASFYELRRQTILMERQNELLQEQNELLRKITPREETFKAGNSTVFYGGYGIDDPRYAYYNWNTSKYVMKKDVIQQDYTIWYCDAMNTSHCWKNASEIPSGYLP